MLIDEVKKRELDLLEAFVIGGEVYRKVFKSIFEVILLIGLPVIVLMYFLFTTATNMLGTMDLMTLLGDMPALEQFMFSSRGKLFYLYMLLYLFSYLVFIPLISISVIKITKDFLAGEEVNVLSVLAEVFSRSHVIVGAVLLRNGAVMICSGLMGATGQFIFLIIPGLINMYTIFYECALILDDKGCFQSMKYSIWLVKGRIWKTILMAILFFGVNEMITNILGLILGGLDNMTGHILTSVLTFVLSSYLSVVLACYYISRKAAKERETEQKLAL